MIGSLLNKIVPEASGHVVFANPGRNREREIPVMEVRFDSKELARKIRKEFAAKKKAGVDFGKVFLTNSVSLATRVRVDILKAIARMNSSEKEDFYVASYASRPIIHVKQKGNEGRSTALTFSDAIAKYGGSLREEDLGEAYRRTGNAFRGQLQQVFVVLQDSVMGVRAGGYGHSAWAPRAAQMKRVREGESTGSAKNFGTPKKQVKKV